MPEETQERYSSQSHLSFQPIFGRSVSWVFCVCIGEQSIILAWGGSLLCFWNIALIILPLKANKIYAYSVKEQMSKCPPWWKSPISMALIYCSGSSWIFNGWPIFRAFQFLRTIKGSAEMEFSQCPVFCQGRDLFKAHLVFLMYKDSADHEKLSWTWD